MNGRCKTTGKIKYTTKRKADRALHTLENKRLGDFGGAHSYRCPDAPSHWHIGNRDGLDTERETRSGTAAGRGAEKRRAPRWNGEEWDAATMTLWARCRDTCEYAHCGRPLGGDVARHHRQRRAIGKDRLSNVVLLHSACHREVHANPAESMRLGVIVSSYAEDPARVPLTLAGDRLVLLDDEGAYVF